MKIYPALSMSLLGMFIAIFTAGYILIPNNDTQATHTDEIELSYQSLIDANEPYEFLLYVHPPDAFGSEISEVDIIYPGSAALQQSIRSYFQDQGVDIDYNLENLQLAHYNAAVSNSQMRTGVTSTNIVEFKLLTQQLLEADAFEALEYDPTDVLFAPYIVEYSTVISSEGVGIEPVPNQPQPQQDVPEISAIFELVVENSDQLSDHEEQIAALSSRIEMIFPEEGGVIRIVNSDYENDLEGLKESQDSGFAVVEVHLENIKEEMDDINNDIDSLNSNLFTGLVGLIGVGLTNIVAVILVFFNVRGKRSTADTQESRRGRNGRAVPRPRDNRDDDDD